MKSIPFLIVLSFFSIISFTQNRTSIESEEINKTFHNPQYFPKVTGQLLNYEGIIGDDFEIKYFVVQVNGAEQETKSTYLNKKGEFSLEFTNALPYQQIFILIGDYFYGGILVNKDLKIIADIQALIKDSVPDYGSGIKFQGTDSDINIFLYKFHQYKSKNKNISNIYNKSFSMDKTIPQSIKVNGLKERNSKLEDIEIKYLKKTDSFKYKWVLDEERKSDYYGSLLVLHRNKEMDKSLFKEIISYKPTMATFSTFLFYRYLQSYLISPKPLEGYEITKSILHNSITNKDSLKLVKEYLIELKKKINKQKFDKDILSQGYTKYQLIYKHEHFKKLYQLYLEKINLLPQDKVSILNLTGLPKPIWLKEIYLQTIIPRTEHEWCRIEMRNVLTDNNLVIGNIYSLNSGDTISINNSSLGQFVKKINNNTTLHLANHKSILELIKSILKRTNNSKAIILDIWASWCSPCIQDMKRSRAKKEKLKEIGVDVIYLCVSDNTSEEVWAEKIEFIPVDGTHIFLNKSLSTEIMEKFKLSGYPSYIFIDNQGNYDPYFVSSITSINLNELIKKIEKGNDD